MIRPSWLQRTILVAAGLFLILWSMSAASGFSWDQDQWFSLAAFLAAVVCFVLAAGPGRKRDVE